MTDTEYNPKTKEAFSTEAEVEVEVPAAGNIWKLRFNMVLMDLLSTWWHVPNIAIWTYACRLNMYYCMDRLECTWLLIV
jgi:hypothetical protein